MTILLDIDGVMLPQLAGEIKLLPDGFKEFTRMAKNNLNRLIGKTNATIVLSSNHRVSFSTEQWVNIFNTRGVTIQNISMLNDRPFHKMMDRATEIKEWIDVNGATANYVIIDDDYSLNTLPPHIKQRWVMTNPARSLDESAYKKALNILLNNTDIAG